MKAELFSLAISVIFAIIHLGRCKDLSDEKRLSKIAIKFGSPSTITFLYEQTFRIAYQNSTYKQTNVPTFCQLKQSNFVASDAQTIDISDYCITNCLLQTQERTIYIVNEKSQFIQFQMQEEGTNQDFKIPYFSLRIVSINMIDQNLKELQILSRAKLIVNQNNANKSAFLITDTKIYQYQSGTLTSGLFNFTNYEESSIQKINIYDSYIIIPDDSTGLQIYLYTKTTDSLEGVNTYTMSPFLNITVSQFFGFPEWQYIQEQISQSGDNSSGNGSGTTTNSFQFNFSIKSLQTKLSQQMSTLNIYTYEQYSKSICVFSLDLVNKYSKLLQKIPTNGRISNFVLSNNYMYAHQIQSKGIRDSYSLIEFQQKTSSVDYFSRQTYPMTSYISKIILSETLSYSLQENIISIIRREVPFKLNNDDEAKQQISVQISEGADDFWNFPVKFKNNTTIALLRQSNSNSTVQETDSESQDDGNNTNGSYFSPYISLVDNDSLLTPVDTILVKNQDSLYIRIIQEHLPHLVCAPDEDSMLNQDFIFYVSLEVFNSKDTSGNIILQTYVEGLDISVYREIFENSTVALVVGLSIGLTLSLIAVIIFCIYFYRMKNHYQLLLQDNSKDYSKEVGASSINTSSNNSSNESYPSTIPTNGSQNQEEVRTQILLNQNLLSSQRNSAHTTTANNNNNNNNNIRNQEINLSPNDIQFQLQQPLQQQLTGSENTQHQQYNNSQEKKHEFYLNGYQIQHINQSEKIPNNTQLIDLHSSDLSSKAGNPEYDFNQKQQLSSNDENIITNINNISNNHSNNTNNNNSSIQNNKQKADSQDQQKYQNNIIYHTEQVEDDEFNSNNSNKSEHISFRNNSLEEQESINDSNSEKSSKGPCAQSQSSKENMGFELISFKSQTTSDLLKQKQQISSPLQENTYQSRQSEQVVAPINISGGPTKAANIPSQIITPTTTTTSTNQIKN